MPNLVRVLTVILILLTASSDTAIAQSRSLYQRLGGYDAIAAVTDTFIGRLVQNPELGKFFQGHGGDSQRQIRQLIVDQLCAVTGGPCLYTGRDMKTTHAGLGITTAHWNSAVQDLVATLNQFKVPKQEQDDLLKIVGPLKDEIVEKL